MVKEGKMKTDFSSTEADENKKATNGLVNKTGANAHTEKKLRDSSRKELLELDEVFNKDDYELKEEYTEEGLKIKLPEGMKKGEKYTRLSVVNEENEIKEVDEKEAKEILQKSKRDIHKVVIEQVSMKGADRVSFVVGADEVEHEGPQNTIEEVKSIEMVEESEFSNLEDQALVDNESKKFELKSELDQKILKFKKSIQAKLDQNHKLEIDNRKSLIAGNNRVAQGDSGTSKEDGNPSDFVYHHQVWQKKQDHEKNNYYYQVESHLELYHIGKSYQDDFESGIRNFGFHSTSLDEEREKTVFGVSAYFNYHTESTIIIFTNKVEGSFYDYYIRDLKPEKKYIPDEDISFKCYKGKGFEIYEFVELKKIVNKICKYTLEELIDTLCESAHIILWDIPSINTMSDSREVFFPVIRKLQNISIIVGENRTKMEEISEMTDYFKKYGVKIKGLLVNTVLKGKKVA